MDREKWSLAYALLGEKALINLHKIQQGKSHVYCITFWLHKITRSCCWQKITAQMSQCMQANITVKNTHSSLSNIEPDGLLLAARLHTMPTTASLPIDINSLLAQYHNHSHKLRPSLLPVLSTSRPSTRQQWNWLTYGNGNHCVSRFFYKFLPQILKSRVNQTVSNMKKM